MKRLLQNPLRPTWLVFALLGALLLAASAACGSGDSQGVGRLAPNQEFRLRIAGDPSTFDPQLASFTEEITVVKQLFRGLFTFDENLGVVPAVALELPTKENGSISADGLTYTIALRNDVTWSDGQPVTAQDFVFAFQRLFDPEAGAQGYYFDFYTAIAGSEDFAFGEGSAEGVQVTALDDFTLRLQLTRQQPTLPTLLALWPASPLRADVIEQHGAAWTEPGNLIGNGPFVLTSYTREDRIVLEANDNYWGSDKPTLQRLVFRIIPEDNAAVIAYQNNELDMTSISAADSTRFEGDPERLSLAQLETFAIQYNNQVAPFDDILVRQAFGRAVDREAYVLAVQQGAGIPALSWLPPGMPAATAGVGQDLAFDPEAAQALLAQAGFPSGEGFPTVTLTVGDTASNRLTAEFLQEQLRQHLGIDLQIETLERGVFFDRFFEGDFQVTWLSWLADYADPENWLPKQFGTDGAFNVLGYSNPRADELFALAETELDPVARLALYDEAHRIIISDQAITPVFHPERIYLVKSHVAGLVTTVLDAEPGDWFATNLRILETGSGAQPPASEPDE